MQRQCTDRYFLDIAAVISTRSTCLRNKVGSVIVRDKHIISTGYNGAPAGMEHCLDIGCMRIQEHIPTGIRQEKCRAVHAEQNAIIQAAVHGVPIAGTTMYCTHQPCVLCAKMIINAGIKKVVYENSYFDPDAVYYFLKSGTEIKNLRRE